MRYLCLAGMLLLRLIPGLYAQGLSADTLMNRWVRTQEHTWSRWQALRVMLEVHRKFDSPFGVRRWQFLAEAYLQADSLNWHVRSIQITHPTPPPETLGFPGSAFYMLTDVMPLRPVWTRWLVQAPAIADTLEGLACWRVELRPPERGLAERATLWFAQYDGRLLQSRLLMRARPAAAPTFILTRFMRLNGLDLPQYRYIEWTHPMRRRMRRYTTLITQEIHYRSYRLEPAAGIR
jgi:hypothetical protein